MLNFLKFKIFNVSEFFSEKIVCKILKLQQQLAEKVIKCDLSVIWNLK